MARVLAVVGTRPEVIKMAPVVRALRHDSAGFAVELCAVRQHEHLLEQALAEWGLEPDHRVEIVAPGRGPAATLGAMLGALERTMLASRPDMVLVHGDTTTTLGASLAAYYAGIPFGHVEAGLRTGDLENPFPEEMHRVVVDRLAAVHYAPTERARQNLLAEGCAEGTIAVIGNTVCDALLAMRATMPPRRAASEGDGRKKILVTGHRRESFAQGTRAVCEALRVLATTRADVEIVYVLHPHPSAHGPARSLLEGVAHVRLIEPVSYRELVGLLDASYLVVTDSGGIQEEAPYLGKPVLVTRDCTERPESVEMGLARLVGTRSDALLSAITTLLDDAKSYAAMCRAGAPFGDGRAAERIRLDLARRIGSRRCA